MRVDALIDALRRSGVEVIYSSELVPPELTVPRMPTGSSPLDAVNKALALSGLALRPVGAKTFVVVRAAPKPVAPVAAPEEPLAEISVYASRYALDGRTLSEPRELSSTDLAMVPGSSDDALRALRALPGLATNASARPYIRGSLTEDVLVRYDGIGLVDPFHLKNFQSLISAIDPAAIERIEVFSGGFPVRYGTRSGGVIDITAPTRDSGYENRISVSAISAGVSSVGHSDSLPLEWLAAIRHSTPDLIEPIEDSFGRPKFSDTLGRLRWQTDNGACSAGWLILDDRLTLGVEDDEEKATARYRDEYLWLAREHEFSPALRTRANVVVTSAERTRAGTQLRPGISSGELDAEEGFDGLEFSNDWTFEQNPRSHFEFGFGFASTHAQYRYSRHSAFAADIAAVFDRAVVEDLVAAVNPHVTTYSLYAANRRKWANFEAELGLRADGQHFEGTGNRLQVSPRLNMRYDLSDRLRLYASAGKFTQAQHVEEWRIEQNQQAPDPSLSSVHSILGVSYETADATRFSIEAYVKRWTTVAPYFDSELDPFSLLPELSPDRILIKPRSSEASGVELSVHSPWSDRLTGWGTLSWSRVADDLGRDDVRRSWDQPLSASLGLAWSGAQTTLSALVGWHRGWPRTPFSALTLGARNSARWNDFLSFDLSGRRAWTFRRGELTAEFDLTNSTNRRNECCIVLERPEMWLESEVDYWLPTIITIGFTYRWKNP